MSSAILYVAIVAIWAGVLIPRWLRRDSAGSQRASEDLTRADAETSAPAEVAEPAPPPRRREHGAGSEASLEPPARAARPGRREEPAAPRLAAARPAAAAGRPASRAETREEAAAEDSRGGPRDQEYKKVLSARRRLLGMLLVLAIASGALAYTRMAAWWVVVPSTVMLLGYLALLYEAGKADAERRELARTRATAAAAAAVAAAKRAAPPGPAAPVPAPDAEVIDISASLTVAGHKFYDQYADAKRRAVGDC